MTTLGSVLLADDEDTFLRSTARLLHKEGYDCDCASDAATAADMLRNKDYDLLISDIKMPGNPNLELICDLPHIAGDLPVILVTGYPSVDSAVQSIQLPVSAYLIKPLDFEELLKHVRISIEFRKLCRVVQEMRQTLQSWQENLVNIEAVLRGTVKQREPGTSVETFIELSFQNITNTLLDLKRLIEAITADNTDRETCHLLECPTLIRLTEAIASSVNVLQDTRSKFKSKELAQLRNMLEAVLKSRR